MLGSVATAASQTDQRLPPGKGAGDGWGARGSRHSSPKEPVLTPAYHHPVQPRAQSHSHSNEFPATPKPSVFFSLFVLGQFLTNNKSLLGKMSFRSQLFLESLTGSLKIQGGSHNLVVVSGDPASSPHPFSPARLSPLLTPLPVCAVQGSQTHWPRHLSSGNLQSECR